MHGKTTYINNHFIIKLMRQYTEITVQTNTLGKFAAGVRAVVTWLKRKLQLDEMIL